MNDNRLDIPQDDHLDALMREALAPVEAPAAMEARIMAALEPQISDLRRGSPVIGRVGVFASSAFASTGFRRVAAAIVVAAGVGVAILAAGLLRGPTPNTVPANDARLAQAKAEQEKLAQLRSDVEKAPVTAAVTGDMFALADAPIDDTINQIKSRVNNADLAATAENWAAMRESLLDDLDALDADPDNG